MGTTETLTAPTAVDLSAFLNHFIVCDPLTNKINLPSAPGLVVSGVLIRVYLAGGVQYGTYLQGGSVNGFCDVPIARGEKVQAQANGRLTNVITGIAIGYADTPTFAPGESLYVEMFEPAAPSGGGLSPQYMRTIQYTTADSPKINPAIGDGQSDTGPFAAPPGAVYGECFVSGGHVLLAGPWPVPISARSKTTGNVLLLPAETQATVRFQDPSGAGTVIGVYQAEVQIVWYSL